MVRGAARTLRANGHELQTTPQNFTEFWNAATRPVNRNGFGLTPVETERLLRMVPLRAKARIRSPAIYPEWRRLVVDYGVSGVQVYDTRIAAAMIVHRVTHILTFNTADFVDYAPEGIVTDDPATI